MAYGISEEIAVKLLMCFLSAGWGMRNCYRLEMSYFRYFIRLKRLSSYHTWIYSITWVCLRWFFIFPMDNPPFGESIVNNFLFFGHPLSKSKIIAHLYETNSSIIVSSPITEPLEMTRFRISVCLRENDLSVHHTLIALDTWTFLRGRPPPKVCVVFLF